MRENRIGHLTRSRLAKYGPKNVTSQAAFIRAPATTASVFNWAWCVLRGRASAAGADG
jgi:hypothetical protein